MTLETTLQRNMLKFHCGHELWCKGCGDVLDARRAVELDYHDEKELRFTKLLCAQCYDSILKKLPNGITIPEPWRIVITDGRLLFSDKQRNQNNSIIPIDRARKLGS